MAIIRGQVSSGGGNEVCGGYTASRISEGTYTVTYNQPFKNQPVVVATAFASSAGADRIVTLFESTTTSFSITTRKAKTSDREDTAFTFYASDDCNS